MLLHKNLKSSPCSLTPKDPAAIVQFLLNWFAFFLGFAAARRTASHPFDSVVPTPPQPIELLHRIEFPPRPAERCLPAESGAAMNPNFPGQLLFPAMAPI